MSYLVKDYMHTQLLTVNIDDSVLAVSKLMTEKGVGYAIALEKTKPAGIVTEKDLVTKVIAKEKDPSTVRVSQVMSTPLITIDLGATLEDAVKMMAKHGIRRLPVVKDNVVQGVFTSRDLTRHFSDYKEKVTRDIINACALYPNSVDLGF
jgi:CBS domain-containing protein